MPSTLSETATMVVVGIIVSYLAYLTYGSCIAAVAGYTGREPAPAPARKEKVMRSVEELLRPFEKRAGLPDMSTEELEASRDRGACLIGCKGRVFDVSSNPMYSAEGSYHLFVGRDASVALAKMKFDKEFLDPTLLHWRRDLDQKELNVLEEWLEKFEGKYPLEAYIKDDGKLKR